MQTPQTWVLNRELQTHHIVQAHMTICSPDHVLNLTLVVLDSNVCHHPVWHVLYVLHAGTCIVIAIVVQNGLRLWSWQI